MFQIMFYTGLVLTFVFLILSIIFFIRNNVLKLIGDVSGWNAKRAIKKINEKGTGEKSKNQAIKSEISKVLVHNNTSEVMQKPLEVRPEQSIMEAIHEAQGNSCIPAAAIFRAEENMIVLAGEKIVENEPAAIESEEETSVLTGEETTSVLAEEETSVLTGEEITSVLAEEETSVLTGEEATSVLAEEETSVLTGEEATSVLAEEETSVLTGEETTSVLAEEETAVLNGSGEITSILAEGETTDILGEETVVVADESTSILNQAVIHHTATTLPEDVAATEISVNRTPMPDIFEVEEDTTVVHTDDSIKIDINEE